MLMQEYRGATFIFNLFQRNQISTETGHLHVIYSIKSFKAKSRGSRAYFTIDFDHTDDQYKYYLQ